MDNIIKRKNKYSLENRVLAVSVTLSSFIGMQFLGVSLNKIALLPLIGYLLLTGSRISINKSQKILLLFYFASIFSVFSGLLVQQKYQGLESRILLYFFQVCLIYIPLLLMANRLHNPIPVVKRTLILIARINTIWAVIQFIYWYGMHQDINDLLFSGLLKGILGIDRSVWNFEAGTLALRVSGFQSDAAFFAIILILGFCLDESKVWKIFYISVCALSMSRTGILVIATIFLNNLIQNARMRKVKIKSLFVGIAVIIGTIGFSMWAYNYIPSVKYQMDYLLLRIQNINSGADSGTIRHLQYIPVSIKVWLFDFDLFRKLVGIGPRCGGIALSMTDSISVSKNIAWAIECDLAEFLMAQGIVGLSIYYVIYGVYKRFSEDYEIRDCLIAISLAGIMYNVLETTLLQVLLIILASNCRKSEF